MTISFAQLPKYPWWGQGTPAYENNLAMKLGALPKQEVVKKENADCLSTLKKYATVDLFPFPTDLDANGLNKHDFVFTRDTFISNQKGDVVISNFSERERQPEAEAVEPILKKAGFRTHRLSKGSYAEGGEFYYVLKDDLIFAGISRNNIHGISEVAKTLGISTVQIVESESFHLDTVFTILTNKNGHLAGILVCFDLIKN